jgi:hypothetical protein
MAEKFKLSEENERQVKVYSELFNDYEEALVVLSRKMREARQKMWDVIAEEYPQVRESYINATYHHDTKELVITKKWDKSKEQEHMEAVVKEMLKDGVEDIINEKIEEKFNQE